MPEPRLPFMAVSPNLRTNRKFVRLRKLLGSPPERDLVGALVMLWSQVFNESPSGDVSTWTDEEIADCAGWEDDDVTGTSRGRPGTNGTFREALETARFIVSGRIHDWDEWGGYLYQVRASEAERKRAYREQQERDRRVSESGTAKPVPGTSADVPVMSTLTNGTNGTNGTKRDGAAPPVVDSAADPLVSALPPPKSQRPRAKFVAPTLEDVRAEMKRRGSLVDPELFHASYTTSGWRLKGGQPIVDWKACITTWEKNLGRFGGSGNGSAPAPNREAIAAREAARRADNERAHRQAIEQGIRDHERTLREKAAREAAKQPVLDLVQATEKSSS